jgi:stage III sporulation protein SpoIIIAA
MTESKMDPGFEKLLGCLPLWLRGPAIEAVDVEEVRFDEGRKATLKMRKGIIVLDRVVSKDDVEFTKFRVGSFNENDRAGIDGALHRISPIRDDNKLIVGLTVRVARHIPGAAAFLKDILVDPENRYKSVLLVGPPGVGKTTILRDTSAILSAEDAYASDVVVVDSSAEIGGAGRVPDPCIGFARRMQIPHDMTQADVLMFAVRNHGPSVIIADEIGYESDAEVIATIAQRGVKVIATGHGTRLSDITGNKHLRGLVGDPDTLQKRRTSEPVFQQALEIRRRGEYYFHADVAASVDALLAGREPPGKWLYQD